MVVINVALGCFLILALVFLMFRLTVANWKLWTDPEYGTGPGGDELLDLVSKRAAFTASMVAIILNLSLVLAALTWIADNI